MLALCLADSACRFSILPSSEKPCRVAPEQHIQIRICEPGMVLWLGFSRRASGSHRVVKSAHGHCQKYTLLEQSQFQTDAVLRAPREGLPCNRSSGGSTFSCEPPLRLEGVWIFKIVYRIEPTNERVNDFSCSSLVDRPPTRMTMYNSKVQHCHTTVQWTRPNVGLYRICRVRRVACGVSRRI